MYDDLVHFEARSFSQNGEDGVLQRLFALIGVTNQFFVEFGVGETGEQRNTRLLEQQGWSGLLLDHAAGESDSRIRKEHVSAANINAIFAKYQVPDEFDLLSIDIDGQDYWVWKALDVRYRPRVVVVEYNSNWPPPASLSVQYDPNFCWDLSDVFGASLTALARLARRRGYALVYCESAGVNAFFLRDDLLTTAPPPVSSVYRPFHWRFPSGDPSCVVSVEPIEISGVILARNEAHQIERCLRNLRPHVDELILLDMESTDRTRDVAFPLVDAVISHPKIDNFDAARNAAVALTQGAWLWYVDADEQVSPAVGQMVRQLIATRAAEFEALAIPFRNYFCGRWIEHGGWWPSYTMPRVLKRGHFQFASRVHGGVEVQGRVLKTPPETVLAVEHFSYQHLTQYFEKLNRYTTQEAQQLSSCGVSWDWRVAIQQMMSELWNMYEPQAGFQDGEQGWLLAWLSGQYRWAALAKTLDLQGYDNQRETPASIPRDLDEVLLEMKTTLSRLRQATPHLPLGVVLRTHVWEQHGYAEEGRLFAKCWSRGDRALSLEELRKPSECVQILRQDAAMLRALCRCERPEYHLCITNFIPVDLQPDPTACFNVLRTTNETDRIPEHWHEHLDRFDEIWVISRHNERAFRRSGVAPEKLRVFPSGVDTEVFSPQGPRLRLSEHLEGRFVFLSIFDWQWRKGWDVLLQAYCEEFELDTGAGLLLKITHQHGHTLQHIQQQVEEFLQRTLRQKFADRTDIVIWDGAMSQPAMAALYRSVDAFVLPTRGEGWGRPFMEAMATGLPVIGTAASGNIDFMHPRNSLLIPARKTNVPPSAVAEIPIFAGHQWYEPDCSVLRSHLRLVFSKHKDVQLLAEQARRDIEQDFNLDACLTRFESAVQEIERRFQRSPLPTVRADQPRVELDGDIGGESSFAIVNDALANGFLEDGSISIAVRPTSEPVWPNVPTPSTAPLQAACRRVFSAGPDVTIRHHFPPKWGKPDTGKWVHIQPWEFGYLPEAWIEPLRDDVDEIWVPSNYVRRVYVDSGIDPEKIRVIPWGIDPQEFHDQVPPRFLPTKKRCVFLYVGGTIARKGFPVALQAYLEEFSANDAVCLVIKDTGSRSFYVDSHHAAQILEAQRNPSHPEIIYLDQHLTIGQLASLYRAGHAFVAPYRAEGFALPILEAIACGVVPIVPRGGPTDDFVNEEFAILLPSTVAPCQHPWACVQPPTEILVDVRDVRRALRWVYDHPSQVKSMGQRGSEFVRTHFTWKHTLSRMLERVRHLTETAPPADEPIALPETTTGDVGMRLPHASVCGRVHVAPHFDLDKLATTLHSLQTAVSRLEIECDEPTLELRRSAAQFGVPIVSSQMPSPEVCDWVLLVRAGEIVLGAPAQGWQAQIAAWPSSVEVAVGEVRRPLSQGMLSGPGQQVRLVRSALSNSSLSQLQRYLSAFARRDESVARCDLTIVTPISGGTKLRAAIDERWLEPWVPQSGDVMLDVGANVGQWTRWLAPSYRLVHAIEPHPRAYQRLLQDLPNNVRTHGCACWDKEERLEFADFERTVHFSAYFQQEGIHTGRRTGTLEVLGQRLDDVLSEEGHIDFIKCDTEGSECKVLAGATSIIENNWPYLLIEIHSVENFVTVAERLLAWSYGLTVLRDPNYEPGGDLWLAHCWLIGEPVDRG